MGVSPPVRALDAGTARLLDANLNRAREGLRVIEDTARFVWNDAALFRRLRGLRHALHRVTASHYRSLVAARRSETDAGRAIPENGRPSIAAVVAANVRRAQEAVRVLEEYSKVFSATAPREFKRIRYRLYREEREILKKL
jgi:thiamine-phosphate pyrophosphorylase